MTVAKLNPRPDANWIYYYRLSQSNFHATDSVSKTNKQKTDCKVRNDLMFITI